MFYIEELTERQIEILLFLGNIVNTISAAFLIAFFILTSKLKERLPIVSILMKNLFFANLIYCFANFLSNLSESHPDICSIEGFLRQFSLFSILIWGSILSRVIYFKVSNNVSYVTSSLSLQYSLAYLVPLIIAALPLLNFGGLEYRYSEAFCWIYHGNRTAYKIFSVLILYFWIWSCIVFISYNTFRVIQLISQYDSTLTNLVYSRLIAYPIMLFLIFIPETIDWFELWPGHPFIFACMHLLLARSIGFFNVVTYGLQRLKEGYRQPTSLSMVRVQDEYEEESSTQNSKRSIKDNENCDNYFRSEEY